MHTLVLVIVKYHIQHLPATFNNVLVDFSIIWRPEQIVSSETMLKPVFWKVRVYFPA